MSISSDVELRERREYLPKFVAALCLCALTTLFWGFPLVAVILTMISSTLLGQIKVRRFVSSIWGRRLFPAIPYLCVLGAPINWTGSVDLVYWVAALSVPLAVHFLRRKLLATAFNSQLLRALRRGGFSERFSESAYYLLPGFFQEVLFRGVVITALVALGVYPIVTILVSSGLFVLDHMFTKNSHVKPSMANLLTWSLSGLVWAGVVVLGGSIWIPVVAHTLLNLPAAVLPHLKGLDLRVVTSNP